MFIAKATTRRKERHAAASGEIDKEKLADPWWRLCNLYTIIDDDSNEVPFRADAEGFEHQREFFEGLHWLNLILKARQMGFTTLADLMALDQCIFNTNYTAAIICDSLPNARKIFRNKVLTPYKKLPALVRALAPLEKESADELVFANGSSISVGVSARSGTLQYLHVSEMGKIARKYPQKAREIVTGSFEAAQKGVIIVESTAEGKTGWFHDAVQAAKKLRDQGKKPGRLDFKLHFFPWWRKKSNRTDPADVIFTDEDLAYFTEVESLLGIKLDLWQRAWYVKKAKTLQDDMKREHPSHEDEAFEASIDGLIYGKEMRVLRKLGRIGVVPVKPGIVINTFWDLGVNDTNFIWLHQRVGAMNRFVKCLLGHNEGMNHYWTKLNEWRTEMEKKLGGTPLSWGAHYLPHDGDHRIQGYEIKTRKQILEECGARQVKVVPRIPDVRDGVNAVKELLSECEFDETGCVDGIAAMDNYSREWDEETEVWSSQPRHDKYSNGADAFRQFAQHYSPKKADNKARGKRESGGHVRSGY